MTSEEYLEIETVASVAATTDSKPGEETIADNVYPLHYLAELRHDPDAIRHLFESWEYPYKRKISRRDYKKAQSRVAEGSRLGQGDWAESRYSV